MTETVEVPREPTEAMLDAGFRAYCSSDGSYRETYRAMLSAAPTPAQDAGGWRDISTAPKVFGEQLLLFDGTRVMAGAWGLGRYNRSTGEYEHAWTDGPQCVVAATHWQPLPAPPLKGSSS